MARSPCPHLLATGDPLPVPHSSFISTPRTGRIGRTYRIGSSPAVTNSRHPVRLHRRIDLRRRPTMATDNSLEGRTILVTGARRGLGRALVEEALDRGATRVYAAT